MIQLKDLIVDKEAVFSHCCQGVCYYTIKASDATYQFEIDSNSAEWKTTYLLPKFKAITLMRWIRKNIENDTLVKMR